MTTKDEVMALVDEFVDRALNVSRGDRPIDTKSYRAALEAKVTALVAERDMYRVSAQDWIREAGLAEAELARLKAENEALRVERDDWKAAQSEPLGYSRMRP